MTDQPTDARFTFPAEVREGKLYPSEPARWAAAMAKLSGKKVTVLLSRERKSRSGQQNRYYWGVIVAAISEWSGYEAEEVHEILKGLFLRRPVLLPTGEELEAARSTTGLTTVEAEEFYERCRKWAAEQGLYLPLPNESVEVSA